MSKELQHHPLFVSTKELMEQSKQQIAVSVNGIMTAMYWQIGSTIKNEVLKNSRDEYGQLIVHTLSAQLEKDNGKVWSEKQLRHCVQFATVFEDEQIVSALRRQLSWTHVLAIMPIEDPLKRDFYLNN